MSACVPVGIERAPASAKDAGVIQRIGFEKDMTDALLEAFPRVLHRFDLKYRDLDHSTTLALRPAIAPRPNSIEKTFAVFKKTWGLGEVARSLVNDLTRRQRWRSPDIVPSNHGRVNRRTEVGHRNRVRRPPRRSGRWQRARQTAGAVLSALDGYGDVVGIDLHRASPPSGVPQKSRPPLAQPTPALPPVAFPLGVPSKTPGFLRLRPTEANLNSRI